jgi:hypothetical protein
MLLAVAPLAAQQPAPCDVFCHSRIANQAEAAGDFASFLAHVRAIAAAAPSHPGVVYAMARAFMRTGAPDSALAWLDRLGRMGDTRDPMPTPCFARFVPAPHTGTHGTACSRTASRLYRLRSPDDTLELFLQPDRSRFAAANGITSTPDGRTLYVAFLEGIARVDVATRHIELVPAPDSASTASVDGLYWHRGSLLAVQGVPTLQRVVRFALSRDGRRIEQSAVLERGLPVVNLPTTGTIVGSRFYYIANSQYDRLSDAGGPLQPPAGPAVRTAIRVIDLRW